MVNSRTAKAAKQDPISNKQRSKQKLKLPHDTDISLLGVHPYPTIEIFALTDLLFLYSPAQMSINRGMDNENLVCRLNGIFFQLQRKTKPQNLHGLRKCMGLRVYNINQGHTVSEREHHMLSLICGCLPIICTCTYVNTCARWYSLVCGKENKTCKYQGTRKGRMQVMET